MHRVELRETGIRDWCEDAVYVLAVEVRIVLERHIGKTVGVKHKITRDIWVVGWHSYWPVLLLKTEL